MVKSLNVHQIVNPPFQSNTFIIENGLPEVIVVDPGNQDITELKDWLSRNGKKVDSVILTHEHFDHASGVNPLYIHSRFRLLASADCISQVANPKRNFSFYYDFVDTFEIDLPQEAVEDLHESMIQGIPILFILTPGHSPGSICFIMGDHVFTGDTLLNQEESPLKLPGSNRGAYARSMDKLKLKLRPGMMVYPGHGEPFLWT